MPAEYVGKLADPDWRRERARRASLARTTPDHHLDRIRQMVKETRQAQNLPPLVADELTLGRVAEILHFSPAASPDRKAS